MPDTLCCRVGRAEAVESHAARRTAIECVLIDPLTALSSRAAFFDRLQQSICRAGRSGGSIGLMLFEISTFTSIVNQIGRPAADDLLVFVASRLREHADDAVTVARLEAEDFVLLCDDVAQPEEHLAAIADPLSELLTQPLTIERVSAVVNVRSSCRSTILTGCTTQPRQAEREATAALRIVLGPDGDRNRSPLQTT
jgi:diguanylate cyclase (GGDEF)-like protein